MTLSRDELLLLILYTSPKHRNGDPIVFGSTRLQKLVFLALNESETIRQLCPEAYSFVPYDYGPYSSDLERAMERFADVGWVDEREAELAKEPEDLSFDDLTSYAKSRPGVADAYILKGPVVQQIAQKLKQLEADGIDTASLLKEFRDCHQRYATMTLDELLRYVYKKYPEMTVNTKRDDLLPDTDETDWDAGEDEESDP